MTGLAALAGGAVAEHVLLSAQGVVGGCTLQTLITLLTTALLAVGYFARLLVARQACLAVRHRVQRQTTGHDATHQTGLLGALVAVLTFIAAAAGAEGVEAALAGGAFGTGLLV